VIGDKKSRKMYQLQLLRTSSTMSLMLSMNHALLMSPEASALLEEDAGKFLQP
jgi:hypothetical protein